MLPRDGGKARPVVSGKSHEENLQWHVVGNGRLMAENVAPLAAFGANALMMLVPAGGRLVRSDPGCEIRRTISPLVARRSSRNSLDDVSAQDMRLNSHRISSLFSSARFSSSGQGGVNLRPVFRSQASSSAAPVWRSRSSCGTTSATDSAARNFLWSSSR